MRRATVLLALVVLLAPATALRSQSADPVFEGIAAFVTEKMAEYQVPGVSLGILRDGVMTTRAFGVTNRDHPLPVTDDTVFQVGSITKTFTGTAIMRLVEQKRIDLNAPVRKYVPNFSVKDPAASRDATVLDLLTHMGGWEGDFFEDTGEGADAVAKYVEKMKDVEQIAPLGKVWSYNNAGFIVAGRVIEVVTGKPYETALQELVLTPLALKSTYVFPADVMTLRFAVGHNSSPKGPQVGRPYPIGRYAHAAGGVISTARDLLTYAQFHMQPSDMWLPETRSRMHSTVLRKQGTEDDMAITWHITDSGGLKRHGHGGATVGQTALLTLVPARHFAVVLLTNAMSGNRLNMEVTRRAIKDYFGVDDTDPAPLAAQPDLAAYAGRYSRWFADVVIRAEDGGLQMQSLPKRGFPNASAPVPPPGPKVPYKFYARDRAIGTTGAQKGARIDFIRNADGSIGWVRAGGRILRKSGGTS
jgi:CubicO group peptidase (beta-lactamase class C family)